MTRDTKLALEGAFEPCENGTNDPAVQRSLSVLLMSSAQTCLLSKLVKAKSDFFYQEGLNKGLNVVMEHQFSLQKFSEHNNID